MRRWLVLLAILPICTGCIPYAYLTLAHTPEVIVKNDDNGAHVYRVDIDQTERRAAAGAAQYTLMQIPINQGGVIPSQLELATTTGVYDPLKIAGGNEHERTHYTMVIRAYKPGCQLITVNAWDKSKPLQWLPATTLAEQENAIDDLLADPSAIPSQNGLPGNIQVEAMPRIGTWWDLKDQKSLGLQPGGISVTQNKALLFASNEYSRLANGPAANSPQMQTTRERLIAKAVWLQNYANGRQ